VSKSSKKKQMKSTKPWHAIFLATLNFRNNYIDSNSKYEYES